MVSGKKERKKKPCHIPHMTWLLLSQWDCLYYIYQKIIAVNVVLRTCVVFPAPVVVVRCFGVALTRCGHLDSWCAKHAERCFYLPSLRHFDDGTMAGWRRRRCICLCHILKNHYGKNLFWSSPKTDRATSRATRRATTNPAELLPTFSDKHFR